MIYNWQRKWKLIGNEEKLEESFYSINKYRCLILLGEPGSGKSTELKKMYNNSSSSIYVDLRGVNSSADLKDKIVVDNNYKGDLDSLSEFYIYLDAFDEAILNYKDIGDSLLKLLKDFEVNLKKVYLRITCRTGIWLDYLEDEFSKLWCKDEVKKYMLCELSDDDIKNSLDAEKIEYEKFYEEAVNKNVYSLMKIPVTMKFLIDEYKVDQSFSNSKKNLYKNGCIKLIEEPDKSKRQKLELDDEYDLNDRFYTAKVLATLTILCGTKYISHNMVKGYENLISSEISELFSIYKKNINSILKTAIFKCGIHGYEWTHLSYAEFLAASFINESFDFEKIIALIKHDYSEEEKTIPQLHALVGWLISINEKVFDWVFNNDFDIIHLGELSSIDNKKKANIVERFITSDDNCGTRYFKYSIIEQLQCEETEKVIKRFLLSGYYTSTYKNYKVIQFSKILKIEYSFDELLMGMAHGDNNISRYFCNKYLEYGNDEQLTRLADILNNRIQVER